FIVFSEIRPKNTDASYSKKIVHQIDSLIATGVEPSAITVVGTSKGGYLTKILSSTLKNSAMNFVLIGCCNPNDVKENPDIHLCGNILSIRETSDSLSYTCVPQKEYSKAPIPHFKEIVLSTGIHHAYVYKALPEWIEPSIAWAKGDYSGKACQEPLVVALDSLFEHTAQPFSGVTLISQNGRTLYAHCAGFVDTAKTIPMGLGYQFVIGSVSKQLTAAMILRELDSGHVALKDPIRKYLPSLPSWGDTVTIHHLLTHTHGIVAIDSPLAFKPGERFDYSQIGYALLGQIIEKTSGKSFADYSNELFRSLGMNSTYHPSIHKYDQLVTGMALDSHGNIYKHYIENSDEDYFTAAARFISTASDLTIWSGALHGGKILSPKSYSLMMTKYAVRQHPMLGPTDYGYGIIIAKDNSQLGQYGYAPGFLSLDYYIPSTKTTMIVLENLDTHPNDHTADFFYHTQIQKIVLRYSK
ncbi:MAG TPA: serine hydrolase domain-containing protein, partial [Candidatus Kapabacteria bacterium]|nr:serine hydrolase domain-containing protein [Candidatus Kapabacteria bacterium]